MITNSDKLWIRPSSIKTFLKNPYEWYQTYILKDYFQPKSYFTVGTAVHHGISIGYEVYIRSGVVPTASIIEEATNDSFSSNAKTTLWEPNEDPNELSLLATRLSLAYHKQIMPTIKPKATELYVEVAIEDNPYIAGVRGTIDLLTEDNEIVDIKTASSLSNNLQLKHELQLSIYSLLAKRVDIKVSSASIHEIIKPTSTLDTRTRVVPIKLTEQKADEILELLVSRISDFYRAVNGEPILDPANLFHIDNKEYLYA